jgi:FkbM family methyltransferase
MGHVKEKYTRAYFMKEDDAGNPKCTGAEGAELFKEGKGQIRLFDEKILKRVAFENRNVLEFGYGRGEVIKYVKLKGARKVVGVDFSKDAYEIATEFLRENGVDADIYHADALDFAHADIQGYSNERFDILIMLDFVEHVPRSELTVLLSDICKYLSEKALIVINTPIYDVDNDVIVEGLKAEAMDTSDLHEETRGMHCNRYSMDSLQSYMAELGFQALSGHFFVKGSELTNVGGAGKPLLNQTTDLGYPILLAENGEKEEFEHARLSDEQQLRANIPAWRKINNGPLAGRAVFIDPSDGLWQNEIVDGTYEKFIFEMLDQLNLEAKFIFDIGAHIGIYSMYFADRVGHEGKVYAFEPNPSNRQRMELILNRNNDLYQRIEIVEAAVSDVDGQTELNYSTSIDNGRSSGSFIRGADTYFDDDVYKNASFDKLQVNALSLDNIMNKLEIKRAPKFVKIDVEGAETLVLSNWIHYIPE